MIFLSLEGNVYELQLNKDNLECVPIKKLTNIFQIESSYSHFLALQKEAVPPIAEWDSQQVADFITRIGFE